MILSFSWHLLIGLFVGSFHLSLVIFSASPRENILLVWQRKGLFVIERVVLQLPDDAYSLRHPPPLSTHVSKHSQVQRHSGNVKKIPKEACRPGPAAFWKHHTCSEAVRTMWCDFSILNQNDVQAHSEKIYLIFFFKNLYCSLMLKLVLPLLTQTIL